MGNTRTGFAGEDLNRQFESPNSLLHPSVYAVKDLITRIQRSHSILAYLDFHAHSKKKSVFFYGPHYPLHCEKYYSVRILPKIICDQSQEFRYSACRFRNEASKQRAARLVLSREFEISNCFTIETSAYAYLTAERSTQAFNEESLRNAGEVIGKGLGRYIEIMDYEAKVSEEKRRIRQKRYSKPNTTDSFTPYRTRSLPTLESVITSIKTAEAAPPTPEPGDLSDTSSEGELMEDHFSAEDMKDLHEEIACIMKECKDSCGVTQSTGNRKLVGIRTGGKGKLGRVTPEIGRCVTEESDPSPLKPIKKELIDPKIRDISPFFLTESKPVPSPLPTRRHPPSIERLKTRRQSSKSPLVSDTRRTIITRTRRDVSDDRNYGNARELRSISPVPRYREESGSPRAPGHTQKSVVLENRRNRPKAPVTRAVLPQVQGPKPASTLSRKLSQIFAKAKSLSSECS